MSERKRLFSLILIMMIASLLVAGITIHLLYGTALKEQRERLVVTAKSQARLIEAVARFDAVYSQKDHPEGSTAATLSQVIDAHKHYRGFGETGEFTLARREGDYIIFLLTHRHLDFSETKPKPVPLASELAAPMRKALSGLSGSMIGLDYRGEIVLAAHEPVTILSLGIVAKIDLAEIRAPFVKTGLIAIFITMFIVLISAALFFRLVNPMIRSLQESEERFRTLVENIPVELLTLLSELEPPQPFINIAVLAYTYLDALKVDIRRAIPFFDFLLGFAALGHTVWVFEGHTSALAAGCREADLLLVDSGLLPALEAHNPEWRTQALQAMRGDTVKLIARPDA